MFESLGWFCVAIAALQVVGVIWCVYQITGGNRYQSCRELIGWTFFFAWNGLSALLSSGLISEAIPTIAPKAGFMWIWECNKKSASRLLVRVSLRASHSLRA